MRKFTYLTPKTLDEAISMHVSHGERARYIAGGTDVLIKLHKGKGSFDHLVDIHDIPELNFIEQNDNGDLAIGPATCFTDVSESPLILKHVPVLSAAIRTRR